MQKSFREVTAAPSAIISIAMKACYVECIHLTWPQSLMVTACLKQASFCELNDGWSLVFVSQYGNVLNVYVKMLLATWRPPL